MQHVEKKYEHSIIKVVIFFVEKIEHLNENSQAAEEVNENFNNRKEIMLVGLVDLGNRSKRFLSHRTNSLHQIYSPDKPIPLSAC